MAKKEKQETKVIPKLELTELLQWKDTMNSMALAEAKLKHAQLELKFMQKEAECFEGKMKLFYFTDIKAKQKSFEEASKEYFTEKSAIEKRIGTTLNNKTINQETLEVLDDSELDKKI